MSQQLGLVRKILIVLLAFLGIFNITAGFFADYLSGSFIGASMNYTVILFMPFVYIVFGISFLISGYGIYKRKTYGKYMSIVLPAIWLGIFLIGSPGTISRIPMTTIVNIVILILGVML